MRRAPQNGRLFWFDVLDLITSVRPPVLQNLLVRIFRHTNFKKGWAWPGQPLLAHEIGVSLSTIERAVKTAKTMGVIEVRMVRTGKNPRDQHNEYRLNLKRLLELYGLPSPTLAVDAMNCRQTRGELPSNGAGTARTHDGGGLEVKQVREMGMQVLNGTPAESAGTPPPIPTLKKRDLEDERRKLLNIIAHPRNPHDRQRAKDKLLLVDQELKIATALSR